MFDILVAGNVNLGTRVSVGRFPIDYEKVRFTTDGVTDGLSGVAYNFSTALVVLGCRVCLATVLGRDLLGDLVRARLEQTPIGLGGVVQTMEHTMRTVILSDAKGGEAMFVDRKTIRHASYPEERFRELLTGASAVYVAHTFWTLPLGRMARTANKLVATDLQNLEHLDSFEAQFAELADVVFFSDERLAQAVDDTIRVLWDDFDVELVVCGQGARGATLGIRRERSIEQVAAVPRGAAVNTTGAGDVMAAGFLSGIVAGQQSRDALFRAQVFAGHRVGAQGGGYLTCDELDRHCREVAQDLRPRNGSGPLRR